MTSEQELLKQAFAALLRGDVAERDRIIRQVEAQRERRSPTIELVKQPDGTYRASTLPPLSA